MELKEHVTDGDLLYLAEPVWRDWSGPGMQEDVIPEVPLSPTSSRDRQWPPRPRYMGARTGPELAR
jgi:hypothetical protein